MILFPVRSKIIIWIYLSYSNKKELEEYAKYTNQRRIQNPFKIRSGSC